MNQKMNQKKLSAKPFVKWAGGKGQILSYIRSKYPSQLGNGINKYCEPFVGGGVVLFDILSNYKLNEILINDINFELINTYFQIQNNISELLDLLESFQNQYYLLNKDDQKIFYLKNREKYNFLKLNENSEVNLEKAALFIFLNRTCFNGLYRVNKKGIFNVPIGSYKKPIIYDKYNLLKLNELLQNVQIQCSDYKSCLSFIDNQTFVYIDPPYRPLSPTSSFTAYSEMSFTDKDQIELSKFIDCIHKKGAKILISNSDPTNEDKTDLFFDNLYAKYQIERIPAKRIINSNAENRGEINELLINNYSSDLP